MNGASNGEALIERQSIEYDPGKKSSWPHTWKVAVVLLLLCVFFITGMLVWYLMGDQVDGVVVDSPSGSDTQGTTCLPVDIRYDALMDLHQSRIQFKPEERIASFVREFGRDPVRTNSAKDAQLTDKMKEIFASRHYADARKVFYQSEASLPGESRPNVVRINTSTVNYELNLTGDLWYPWIPYSPAGSVQGLVLEEASSGSITLLSVNPQTSLQDQLRDLQTAGSVGALVYDGTQLNCSDLVPTLTLNQYGGDPATPGQPAIDGVSGRLSQAFPVVVAQSISCQQAAHIKALLHSGTAVQASIISNNRREFVDVVNVHATVDGSTHRDQLVVVGANRNSYHGKASLATGAMLELWYVMMELFDSYWTPKRTLLLASWGGGDLGSIGSVEFMEEMGSLLNGRVVAYIDLDLLGSRDQSVSVTASSSLIKLTSTIADKVGLDLSEVREIRPFQGDHKQSEAWFGLLGTSYINLQHNGLYQSDGSVSWPDVSQALRFHLMMSLVLADYPVPPLQPNLTVSQLWQTMRELNILEEIDDLNDALTSIPDLTDALTQYQSDLSEFCTDSDLPPSNTLLIEAQCYKLHNTLHKMRATGLRSGQRDALLRETIVQLNTLKHMIMFPI